MANNYIPGFTPSLRSQPVKRMALGGRMESGRWFDGGRDRDTGDIPYTSDIASAAPAATVAYQSHPTAQPVETAPYYADYGFDPLYQTPQSGLAQAAQPATPPGALPAGMSWGAYSTPNDPTSQYIVNFSGKNKNNPLKVGPDTPVFLYDNRTKQIIASGVGREGADAVAAAASSLGAKKDDAWWDIYTGPAGATDPSQFKVALSDAKNKNFGQRFLSAMGTILPIAVQFIPGLGQASLLAKVGAGAAAGAAGSALKGQDILKGALIGGVTSGALNAPVLSGGKSLSGVVGGALQSVPGVGDALKGVSGLVKGGTSYIDPTGGIVTEATKSVAPQLISGAFTSGLQGALSTAAKYPGTVNYGDQVYGKEPTLEEQFDGILVKGGRSPNVAPAVSGGAGALANAALDANGLPENVGQTQEVIGTKKPETPLVPPPPVSGYDPITNTITAVAEPEKPITDAENEIGVGVPPITSVNIPPNAGLKLPDDGKGLSATDYIRLAGLAAGLVGDLTGKGSPGKIPGGLGGGLSPIFSSQLPTSNLPPATTRPASLLPQSTQDWYRYGYGPEQSFFSNVPQGAPNTSTAYTGYAEGGSTGTGHGSRSSFAVGGPGDGRDDKIPAMLSDGEYVMDAETVAMLGNGSSKAGADALDKFRVAVRKHKGRDLAKGKFSANAKKPDQYLKGRK